MSWPIGTQQFGSYQWLMREVGDSLGLEPDANAWDHEQHSRVDSIVQRGLKQFYTPVPIPGERNGHQWSFLYPTVQLTLEDGESVYDLPAGFEALTGPIMFDADQDTFGRTIAVTSERRVAQQQSRLSLPGIPVWAAVRVKEHDATSGTAYEIVFYPEPDKDFTVNVPCKISPAQLVEGEFPYGGEPHYETMRAVCLATAAPGDPAVQEAYMRRLTASVTHDRLSTVAETLGRNTDLSDGVSSGDYRDMMNHVVTFNGVAY